MTINLTKPCRYLCQFSNNEASINIIDYGINARLVIRKLAFKLIVAIMSYMGVMG